MTQEKKIHPRWDFKHSGRLGYEAIVSPRAYEGKGDPKFSADVFVPADSPDLAEIKKLVYEALKAEYPGKKLKFGRLTQEEMDAGVIELQAPWSDGTKAADKAKENREKKGKPPAPQMEVGRGLVRIKMSCPQSRPPGLAAVVDGKFIDLNNPDTRAAQTKHFYSGAYVAPEIAVGTYGANDGRPGGANLFLNSVLFVRHGDRLSGQRDLAEVFKSHIGKASTVDPGRNSLDDEIPF